MSVVRLQGLVEPQMPKRALNERSKGFRATVGLSLGPVMIWFGSECGGRTVVDAGGETAPSPDHDASTTPGGRDAQAPIASGGSSSTLRDAGSAGGPADEFSVACQGMCDRYPETCLDPQGPERCRQQCVAELEPLSPECAALGVDVVRCMRNYLDPRAQCTVYSGQCTGGRCPGGILSGCGKEVSALANCETVTLPWPLSSSCTLSGSASLPACDQTIQCGDYSMRAVCSYPSAEFGAGFASCECYDASMQVGAFGTNSDGNTACLFALHDCGSLL